MYPRCQLDGVVTYRIVQLIIFAGCVLAGAKLSGGCVPGCSLTESRACRRQCIIGVHFVLMLYITVNNFQSRLGVFLHPWVNIGIFHANKTSICLDPHQR